MFAIDIDSCHWKCNRCNFIFSFKSYLGYKNAQQLCLRSYISYCIMSTHSHVGSRPCDIYACEWSTVHMTSHVVFSIWCIMRCVCDRHSLWCLMMYVCDEHIMTSYVCSLCHMMLYDICMRPAWSMIFNDARMRPWLFMT